MSVRTREGVVDCSGGRAGEPVAEAAVLLLAVVLADPGQRLAGAEVGDAHEGERRADEERTRQLLVLRLQRVVRHVPVVVEGRHQA